MSGSLTWNRTSSSSGDRPRGHPVCTLHSGLLPASLASAACCPLLRGTLEGAGASCALTGTRETGWSAARSAKARGLGERVPLECGLSACCTTRARSIGQQHDTCSGRARYLSSDGNEVSSRDRRSERTRYAPHADGAISGVLLAQGSHGRCKKREDILRQDIQASKLSGCSSGARELLSSKVYSVK